MKPSDKICAYDSLFTDNHIQMLKILLSTLAPPLQSKLAIYIKFLELKYALHFFRANPSLNLFSYTPNTITGPDLIDELLPYCNPTEKEQFTQIQGIFQSMKNVQEMMDIFEMMKDMTPEFTSENDVSQMMDMMQTILNKEE